ncbi:Bcr/CflA family multidrug efflux MFS transporter [Serratia ureilytica]|uniref:purine nucleoside transporter PunC n=1 Tax=Serratia ureilytica TaxID=300181 RepID=UPI0018E75102|nr:purine nucleoside transporter PunC [Serratia ureilytica]MBJ2114437.1 Bcr/CflA family multidrug efflux MFS transporter [Serratia ureilytica]
MRNFSFMLYLSGLSMLGFLATDMYLPAFSLMEQELGISSNSMGASLSIYLAGFSLAQLIWGPLSDRYGYKTILLMGLTIFALGCLCMLWVENIEELWVLRFIQAVGVCAASISWQSIVVDRYQGMLAKKVLATIMPLVALSPALAPLMGAWLISFMNWRAIFTVQLIISIALMIPTILLKVRTRLDVISAPKSIGFYQLLKSPIFRGNVLIYSACSAGFFAWLTGSPFILAEMGYSPTVIGLSYIPQTFAFIIGGFSCRIALTRTTGSSLLPWLLCIYAISVVGLYLVATMTIPTLTTLLIPFCIMSLVDGAIYPVAVGNTITSFSNSIGKTVSLQNTLQLGLCFIASILVSANVEKPLKSTVTVMLATVFLATFGYLMQRGKFTIK